MPKVTPAALFLLLLIPVLTPGPGQAQPTSQQPRQQQQIITWGQILNLFRRPPTTPRGSRPANGICPVLPARRTLTAREVGGDLDPATVELVLRSHPTLSWQGAVQKIIVQERGAQTSLWQWMNPASTAELSLQQIQYSGPELLPGQTYHITFEGRDSVTVAVRRVTQEQEQQLQQERDRLISRLQKFRFTPEQITRHEIVFWGERHQIDSEATTLFLEQTTAAGPLQQSFNEAQQDFCEGRFESSSD